MLRGTSAAPSAPEPASDASRCTLSGGSGETIMSLRSAAPHDRTELHYRGRISASQADSGALPCPRTPHSAPPAFPLTARHPPRMMDAGERAACGITRGPSRAPRAQESSLDRTAHPRSASLIPGVLRRPAGAPSREGCRPGNCPPPAIECFIEGAVPPYLARSAAITSLHREKGEPDGRSAAPANADAG